MYKIVSHLFIFLLTFTAAKADAEVRNFAIGAMTELSGTYSSLGEECLRGYKIAEEAFSKSESMSIRVIYGDHQRQPREGITEFWKLLREENPIAMVSNAAPVVMAINPLARDQKIPFAGLVVLPDFLSTNPFAYRFWPTASAEGNTIASKLRDRNFRKLAIITLQDEYPVLVSKEVEKQFKAFGGQVVFSEDLSSNFSDFASLFTRLRSSHADVIFLNVLGNQLADVLRRLREQNFNQQIVGTFSLSRDDIRQAAGTAAEGVWFEEINGEKPQFQKRLKEKFGVKRTTGINYACYMALATVLQTISLHPSIVDKASLQTALSSTSEVPLLDGSILIHEREAQFELIFRTVRESDIKNLENVE